jgi:hypothetical protein
MDKLQETQYWALFWNYRTQDVPGREAVRERIKYNISSRNSLRADAAFFLLLNFDQMILAPTNPSGRRDELTGKLFDQEKLERAFDIIMENLIETGSLDPDGYSAHSVIRSIDQTWDRLAPILAWA